jgi:DNA polymerase III alpha subunit
LDVTGISFGLHPATLLPAGYVPAVQLQRLVGKRTTVAGFVATARRARTNDGRVMGFVTLEDSTGLAEVSFFPDRIGLYRSICSYGGPVWVRGRVNRNTCLDRMECAACGKWRRPAACVSCVVVLPRSW